jgi:transposase
VTLYCGIDLHSTNNYLGIYDQDDREVMSKRLPNDLATVLRSLEPYREELAGIAVESTYNWYWLVDGLRDHNYNVVLANPAANTQYNGLKYTDDHYDSRWLAQMLRLGILKSGYIYPPEERPIRDLLRKRMRMVQSRTAQILSLQNIISRNTGQNLKWRKIEEITDEGMEELFNENKLLVMAARVTSKAISTFNEQISVIEKTVKAEAKVRPEFKLLKSIYGVGTILGLTIMYETGEISRFSEVGDFCSYARCVGSRRISNGKKKGENNTKNGNRFLAWAFVEAANHACWKYVQARAFVQRKSAKANYTLAIKALAHKLARASYYVMRDQVEFDPARLFG